MTELPKTFDPAAIEAKWYAHWESSGAFRPSRPDAVPYTIVMPPPNVTGSLHIGHALDNTLQDILIRHARLQGKDALWVVGTDHAGIATQMVVERQMALHQDKRTNYSRDDFIAKVWEWKAESGGTITQQLRRLGASCDWENERFTMDEGFSKAVTKVFVELYNQGLLYRDKRLVNWDPGLKTAISDLEVEQCEVNGKFWHFKYPLEDGSGYISVATTRPETMLADMAVAVNAEDARYTHLIGKNVRLPITGRLIPIIADEHADPELGSGAVKITPGHDFNDFEVGKRAGLKPSEMLNMFDGNANVVQTADGLIPDRYIGLHRFKKDAVDGAREMVVQEIEAAGLLEKVEDRVIQTPFGDRSGVVIEPWLTDQWYVDAKTLAGPAIEAVRSGAIKVVPKSWEKTYYNWMENIQPWCVSRQLWWGHRIPAWYGPEIQPGGILGQTMRPKDDSYEFTNDSVFVAEDPTNALELAVQYVSEKTVREGHKVETVERGDLWARLITDRLAPYDNKRSYLIYFKGGRPSLPPENGRSDYELDQDNDVLDTWFSSALWPFGTLGWPEDIKSSPSLLGDVAARSDDGGALAPSSPPPPAARAVPLPETSSRRNLLLARHYPNDVLISGFDILFFWDARMIMQGLHFMKEVPWKTLYLHGLVRAADGSKMSKSKGNTVDPLGLIDQYGADALRFTLTAMESQGRDIKLDEKRVEGYRNFATKLWNAARFCQSNGIGASASVAAPPAELPVNRWIIGEVVETLAKLDAAIADLRFDAMADTIYHFAWGTFCDWYLELIKPVLSPLPLRGGAGGGASPQTPALGGAETPHPNPSPEGEGLSEATETRAVAAWAFDQILVMLHPFMPFITEELWGAMGARERGLIHANWPEPRAEVDVAARVEIDRVKEIVTDFRRLRVDLNVSARNFVDVSIYNASNEDWTILEAYIGQISRMCLLNFGKLKVEPMDEQGASAVGFDHTDTIESFVGDPNQNITCIRLESQDLVAIGALASGFTDNEAERIATMRKLEAATKERDALSSRLNNPAFIERAKPEAVEKARADHAEKAAEAERLTAALARLG